ncbi:hypothetical protein OKJ48_21745 [Streptomyces kunmingensis]|uniref:Uncharacterized protein n=1 Tax=Streptomyces kunmingensis TaxID=68225 RepID=A0ABU6CFE6_9ACTN|nr:hypothetical protein [Streptomyces kunmingensis]MEB3962852.1 hypothetical protein [Streptomyces kunmingensis]
MSKPIIVYQPSPSGGRRVRVAGEILGLAHDLRDVAEFLRHAGLEMDETDVESSPLIEWRGGGPGTWPAPW